MKSIVSRDSLDYVLFLPDKAEMHRAAFWAVDGREAL
jgi:hypothetical protein